MSYVSVVKLDAPSNWWRLADPGGAIAQDIGGATPHIPLTVPVQGWLPYTGPSSDGGAGARLAIVSSAYENLGKGIPLLNLWTIECWGWNNSVNQQCIFSLSNATSLLRCFMRLEANGNVVGTISGIGSATWATNIGTEQWHHYALTYDHVTLRLYVDGVQRATFATVTSTTSAMSPAIGEDINATTPWSGFMSDAAYYNATLTSGQIAAHFAAADQVASIPTFKGGTTFDPVNGNSVSLGAQLDQILSSVRKVF